jgi:hypothetical protein
VSARPAGAYGIANGSVRWRLAVDVNRLFATIGAVTIAYLFTRVRVQKARRRSPSTRLTGLERLSHRAACRSSI